MNNLCFIFGSPRSGTTWIWGLLESHPVTIPFVKCNIKNMHEDTPPYATSESGIYINNMNKASGIISKFSNHHAKRMVIEKTPAHILKYKKIYFDFPNAKYILIDRHPLSICNSLLNSNMKATQNFNLEKSIAVTKKYLVNHDKIIALRKENIYSVSYENLLEHTEHYLLEIYSFLNLDEKYIKQSISENYKSTKVKVPGLIRKAEAQSYISDMHEFLEYTKHKLKNEIYKYENRWNNKN